MPNLDPKIFPTLPGGHNLAPTQPPKQKKWGPPIPTYSKPPKTNDELLPRTTSRYAIAINTLNHSFSDINSQNKNAYRFEQTFSEFAEIVSNLYTKKGACVIINHQKAGWVEIGFRDQELRDQALPISLTHENQNFQPIRAFSRWEMVIKVSLDNIPVDEEIGVGKKLEDRLRGALEQYGKVIRVTHLRPYPNNPNMYKAQAIAILIPNENVISKKEDELPGSVNIPRSLTLLNTYEIDVNPDRCARRCTRCREVGHAPSQCPRFGSKGPKLPNPITNPQKSEQTVGQKRHRGPLFNYFAPATTHSPTPTTHTQSHPPRDVPPSGEISSNQEVNPFNIIKIKSSHTPPKIGLNINTTNRFDTLAPQPTSNTKPHSPPQKPQQTSNLKPTHTEPDIMDEGTFHQKIPSPDIHITEELGSNMMESD
ncbi:hypothetical protein CONCODRAFT_7087 [Conidiobolus coronatus NRRL 28638]|uniref:4Fe-4S ferredoxin-type domain-containing protein n=1 Tax=Conidiobolus coronatus (strain ATCC 28846 / CBS 209.66 / NRRL 28638) TaxID=796925 RepID=A0A137P5P0_CONC2|nr:hypothetical protein CONCODRAFT_7087 [Conidiobolus coronatus NRRL 28638]|eukprot:KXN70332.1 hypothetical protein CONCODRAFT_7087 [Conidiobolus coronatus NRRL 28638]